MATGRQYSIDEIAEDIAEIKSGQNEIRTEISRSYVRADLYEAKHEALRADLTAKVNAVERSAAAALRVSWWALALICALVIAAIITFVASAVNGG